MEKTSKLFITKLGGEKNPDCGMSCCVQKKSTLHEMPIVEKPYVQVDIIIGLSFVFQIPLPYYPYLSYYPIAIYIGYIDIHSCIYKYISWSKYYYVAYVNCYGVSPLLQSWFWSSPWKPKIILNFVCFGEKYFTTHLLHHD